MGTRKPHDKKANGQHNGQHPDVPWQESEWLAPRRPMARKCTPLDSEAGLGWAGLGWATGELPRSIHHGAASLGSAMVSSGAGRWQLAKRNRSSLGARRRRGTGTGFWAPPRACWV
ncbi:hypothetical protein PMIN07_012148 [Paraphaeosphaeria minitans]